MVVRAKEHAPTIEIRVTVSHSPVPEKMRLEIVVGMVFGFWFLVYGLWFLFVDFLLVCRHTASPPISSRTQQNAKKNPNQNQELIVISLFSSSLEV